MICDLDQKGHFFLCLVTQGSLSERLGAGPVMQKQVIVSRAWILERLMKLIRNYFSRIQSHTVGKVLLFPRRMNGDI